MSGIAAILHFDDQPVDRKQMDELIQALSWRGPDRQGNWINGSVAMGAVQLCTTPEDWLVSQPVTMPQGECLALDGRIDNRADLGRILAIPESALASMSDVTLLWLAYQKWGETCVDHLIGAYAFIIWDAQKRELFCGRDPIGLRTFFYHWDGRRFYAASTLQSLRGLGLWQLTLNDDYIWDYLTTSFNGSYDAEATPFSEIKRLPGGHFLRLTEAGPVVKRYWKPWELSPLQYKKDAEYTDHLRELFQEVVAAHCRAAAPVAVALSGGLDSASIFGIARQMEQAGQLPAPALHTFTLVWQEAVQSLTGYADGEFAEVTIEKFGGPAHYLVCDGVTMFDQVPHRGPVPQDEPNFHIYTPWFKLEQKVKEMGSRVLLTGMGADEGMVASLFFIVDWLCNGRVRGALRAAKNVATVTPHSFGQILFNLVLAGLGPRSLAYKLHQMQPKNSFLGLDSRFHARMTSWLPEKERLIRRSLDRHRLIPKNFKAISGQAQFEASLLLVGDNTRLWSGQYLGLPANIDQRYPFFDRRLIEFFLRIPNAQKVGLSGDRKLVMRRAMAGTLPDPVCWRRGNTDYGFVVREGLNQHWQQFQDLFTNSRAAAAGYIDGPAFLQVLNARRLGSGIFSDADIIPILGLEFWLREIE
jgi:asparagine synthase (glutamine-hydrolysing)